MKKYLVLAIAALGMFAACEKNNPDLITPTEDEKVAIQFGINAPSMDVTKTKAAVNEWNNTKLYVYGFKNTAATTAVGDGRYNVAEPYINAVAATTTPSSGDPANPNMKSVLEVTQEVNGIQVPFYYANNDTYDFYGYHVDDATVGAVVTGTDEIKLPVTIDGSQDLMYAKADQAADVDAVIAADPATTLVDGDEIYAYSAWAARRGVQPTLKFNHALTRFDIFIKGNNAASETVTIKSIKTSAVAEGEFTVVGANLGWASTGQPVDMTLMGTDGNAAAAVGVVNGSETQMGDCFMVAPNMTEITFTLESEHEVNSTAQPLPETVIKLTPDKITQAGVSAGITEFAEGNKYKVTIVVYGPEQIEITAELVEWADGGEYTYDPDEDMKPTI